MNRVTVFFPNIFFNDKVVALGINDVLALEEKNNEVVESFSHNGGSTHEKNVFDPVEF